MGQRSQIYIRYNQGKNIVAYHLQWNWGEHMINRAYQLLDFISKNTQHTYSELLKENIHPNEPRKFLSALIQMNLEIGSYVGGYDLVAESLLFNMGNETFKLEPKDQDNNDGYLVIDVYGENEDLCSYKENLDTRKVTISAGIWNGNFEQVTFEQYAKKYKDSSLSYLRERVEELTDKEKITQAVRDYVEEEQMWDKVIKKAKEIDSKYQTIDDDLYKKIFSTTYNYKDNLSEKEYNRIMEGK